MKSTTWIELSEGALRHNLRFLRKQIGPEAIFYSVVKGGAYGHGIATHVPMAERCGVRHFGVYSAEEAAEVHDACGADSEIMIMGAISGDDLEWAVEHGISFFVFDVARADAALRAARRVGRPGRIHLEVETGLFRTGLDIRGFRVVLRRLMAHPEHLRAVGLCTHLCGAESSANFHRIGEQLDRFDLAAAGWARTGLPPVAQHVACSAAVFNVPGAIRDLVRVGIAQYGYWPSEETRMQHARGLKRRSDTTLRRVMSWRSRVLNVKSVPSGAFLGYGLSYQALRRMRVAGIPVGYAHGFPRAQSNTGVALVRGRRCRVVGTVNMNMLTLDVTDVPGVRPGDEVVLIGHQGDEEISVGAFGEQTHSLNYEVLVRISPHIPRSVVA